VGAEARSPVIAVDVNGADDPCAAVLGAVAAADAGIHVLLVGAGVAEHAAHPRIEAVEAPVSIAKDPDPARAVRRHPDASVVRAARAVGGGGGAARAAR
jgi:glycerol-3-phosphate acyltransferase PlsX